ncbi:MAG: HEPN domain-containing protein [Chitinophagaceae bacterium]|nr:HEPN domain-containing protein [Chitinophagaceae bacterium]
MNTPSKEDIIRIKIAKARRTLYEAEKMIEFNFMAAGLNRLYYGCFYAATALLFSKDIFTKTHSGVKQLLGLHFISTGLISLPLGKFYGEVFINRQGSDYDDFAEVDPELVKEFAIIAEQFVSNAQNILEL